MPNSIFISGGTWNGKHGGGRRVLLKNCEIFTDSEGNETIHPTAKFVSDTKELGRKEITRQITGISDVLCPPVIPPMPEEPTKRPLWEPNNTAIYLTAVLIVILAAAVIFKGVGW